MLEKEGLDENDVVYDFEELLDDTAGPVLLAAHNAQFDLQFAGTMAERYAQPCAELLARADYLDTLTVYKDRRPYPHKLANAIAAYKLEDKVQNSHREVFTTRRVPRPVCSIRIAASSMIWQVSASSPLVSVSKNTTAAYFWKTSRRLFMVGRLLPDRQRQGIGNFEV
mgnify:CR=1 FL=1